MQVVLFDCRSKMNDLSEENYRKILKKCWAVPGIASSGNGNSFPEPVNLWVSTKSNSLGVPYEYIAYPLLSAISYSMGTSFVNVTSKYKEPIIVYTLVAGRSGTNKSASLELAKNLVRSISQIDDDTEPLFDTGTLEGLLSQLKVNDGSILCAPDEFSSFVDGMDKHSTGNSDRARYLSLHSGSSWSKRIKGGNLELKNPRFNFCSFIQNYPLAQSMTNANHYEGFYPRFLIATPAEVFTKFAEKVHNSEIQQEIDMNKVIQRIYDDYHPGINYINLSKEATELLADYHDNVVVRHREEMPFEDMKTMVLSKSISNLIRVSAIISAIRVAAAEVSVAVVPPLPSATSVIPTGISPSGTDSVSEMPSIVDEEPTAEELVVKEKIILGDDMKMALRFIKYSVDCTVILSSVDKPKKIAQRKLPNPNIVDDEYIIMHKTKVKKMHSHKLCINNCIPLSVITKDHLYPQLGGVTGKDLAINFLKGMTNVGLGSFVEDCPKPYFQFIDINDIENLEPHVISLLERLQLQKVGVSSTA